MPNTLQSFLRYIIPGSMFILTISPEIAAKLLCCNADKLSINGAMVSALLLLIIPLGFVFFIIYFAFYHNFFEKHAMQMEECRALKKWKWENISWCKWYWCSRYTVSNQSAAIWYYIDTEISSELNTWLRNTGAILHSMGASTFAIGIGILIKYYFSLGMYLPIYSFWLTLVWLVIIVSFLFYRWDYKKRYMQRLTTLIRSHQREINSIEVSDIQGFISRKLRNFLCKNC